MKKRNAFSLPELIFIIILVALLAAVAIPKLMATREDAKAAAALENINTIRKEIVGYVLASGEIKPLISQMSPVGQRLIFANLAHEEPYKLYIKLNKQEKDCAYFEIKKQNGYKLYLLLGPSKSAGCKIVQERMYVVDYPINLLGSMIYDENSSK